MHQKLLHWGAFAPLVIIVGVAFSLIGSHVATVSQSIFTALFFVAVGCFLNTPRPITPNQS
jgi:hypothetical protein